MTWILVAGDFTPLGGMDRANHALAMHLAADRREEVHLVGHRAWEDLTSQPNVTLHRIWRPLGSHTLGKPLLAALGRRRVGSLAGNGARVIVNGGNCPWPDVNWVHYVHAVQGTAGDQADERIALSRARLIICNSRRTRDDVVERVGVPAAKAHVVYYGAGTEFQPADPAQRTRARRALGLDGDRLGALFIGALGDRRKGFDTLFASWTELCRDSSWDVDLIVVGTGRELPAWRERVRGAGLDSRVRFLGFRKDVPDIIAGADVLVHPARYEAYGLGVQEALSAGLPALVTASSGIAERYPPDLEPLLIRDPEDACGLADGVLNWRRESDRWRERTAPFAAALRARTWQTMAAEIADLTRRAA
jgi:glycosyltransferase involved in cell wall biosynthesis